MPSSSSPAPDVRADTRYRSACPPALTTAGPAQPPARAVALGVGRDARQFVAGIRLGAGQRRDLLAGDQAVQRFALRRRAGLGDGAAHHERVQEGLDHQAAPQRLEHHGDVETGAAQAAVALGEQRADGAQLGIAAPEFRAMAALGAGVAVARGDVVLLGDKAPQHVGQHAAVFGVLKIHGRPSQSQDHLGDDVFWISLEPPKIDSLRLLKYCAEAVSAPSGRWACRRHAASRRRRPA